RPQGLQNRFTNRLFADPVGEVLRDIKLNVGLKKRLPNLTHPFPDVRFGQTAPVDKRQGTAHSRCDPLKHGTGRDKKRADASGRLDGYLTTPPWRRNTHSTRGRIPTGGESPSVRPT